MSDLFNSLLDAFDNALKHGASLSVFLGYVIAIGLVQWIKRTPIYSSNKWAIRALALPIGSLVTFFAWPVHEFNAVRFLVAFAVGVSSSWVYQLATLALYWKWPQLEKHLSAAPAKP